MLSDGGEEVFLGVVEIDALERNGHDLVPDASMAAAIWALEENLPVPRIKREEKTITDLQCIIHESMPQSWLYCNSDGRNANGGDVGQDRMIGLIDGVRLVRIALRLPDLRPVRSRQTKR